jgi:hypothetical protein
MNNEKITTAPSGYLAFILVLVLIAGAALLFISAACYRRYYMCCKLYIYFTRPNHCKPKRI